MKRFLMGSCLAVACAAGLGAQTPPGTTKPQQPPTTTPGQTTPAQKPTTSADSAVLRGCLKAGDQTGTFMLTNATATSGGTMKNATVQLAGSPTGINLKDHVGHTVEVTGMLAAGDMAKPSGTGTTGAGAPGTGAAGTSPSKPAAGAASTSAASAGKITVKAVKHVKEGC